jgi:uncharacterized protein (UPF0303 family)
MNDTRIGHDLERIALQEQTLVAARFDADFAWQAGSRLREMAMSRALPVAIEIRTFGQPFFYSALAGATPDNANWVRRKRNTVAHFRCSSYAVGLRLAASASTLAATFGLSAADYATHGGGFPLTVQGAGVIGSITVSGLPQREDHGLIVEMLCGVLGHDHAPLALPQKHI